MLKGQINMTTTSCIERRKKPVRCLHIPEVGGDQEIGWIR